jgi:hypothetical protein
LVALSLYWKSGIEWVPLEDANFKDAGVVFKGLGIEGGVPLKDLKIDADLPIFNSGTGHKKRTSKDYFIKGKESDITPYEYTLDMVRGRLIITNSIPIKNYLRLDVEKYTKEQSILDTPRIQTDEEKAEEKIRRKDRDDAIKAAIEQYEKELEVVTPARRHQLTEYCNLEK